MFRVFIPALKRWIEDVPASEALVYKEEGFDVVRMEASLPETHLAETPVPEMFVEDCSLEELLVEVLARMTESNGLEFCSADLIETVISELASHVV